MKKLILFLLLSIFIFSEFHEKTISVKNHSITVELALNKSQRKKGLMFRKELAENRGMLFVFKKSRRRSFWMKNTSIPLSIAFINKDGIILNIKKMHPFSLKPVRSEKKCRFALEVLQGWFSKNKIKVSDKVNIPADILKQAR